MAGRIEKRAVPDKPFDVLVQHLVTVALGGGFTAEAVYDEVARHLGLSPPDARRVPVGARLRRPGRRQPRRVSRVPPRRRRPRGRLSRAEPGDRAPPQAQRRHDRQRFVDAGEVPVGRPDRRRRGGLRRAPEEGRLLRLRRPHARVRPRRRDDRLRQARRRQESVHDRLGRRQDAALERARRLGDGSPRRRRAGRLLRSRDGGGQADARDADAPLAHPDAEHAVDREAGLARGPAPVPLSVRRQERPHRLGSLLAWRLSRTAEHVLDRHQRLRLGAPRPSRSTRRRSSTRAFSTRAICSRTSWPA